MKKRHRFTASTERWNDVTPGCSMLRQTMLELLNAWGAFLDFALYQEALVHFLGGSSNLERQISLRRGQMNLGTQRMLTHAPDVAFRITAYTESQSHVESHFRRLLALTNLKAIQWINLNHAQIEFTTIQK